MNSSYQSFEEAFHTLLEKAKDGPVPLETFLTILSGKGKLLLLIFITLGFGQIPIVPLILGPFIIYLGFSIAIGKNFIWIPRSILPKKIPSYFLVSIINQILRLLKFMKRWSKPRYEIGTKHVATRVLNGLMIVIIGTSFAACPPVPLTGLIAFIAVFSIAIGMMNNDGIYIIIGYFGTLFYVVITLLLLKFCSFTKMVEWVNSLF
jgi:hypothetical protein